MPGSSECTQKNSLLLRKAITQFLFPFFYVTAIFNKEYFLANIRLKMYSSQISKKIHYDALEKRIYLFEEEYYRRFYRKKSQNDKQIECLFQLDVLDIEIGNYQDSEIYLE